MRRHKEYLKLHEDVDEQVFRIFDRDGDGKISRDDFFRSVELLASESGAEGSEFLYHGPTGNREQWDVLWADMDKNADGAVSQKEFIKVVPICKLSLYL